MIDRRIFLAAALWVASTLGSLAQQQKPRLLILPNGVTAPILSIVPNAPRREKSLRGWLVCNGAEIGRETYRELFDVIGDRFGEGDSTTTFQLPMQYLEMNSGGEPIRGIAVCPTSKLGLAGELSPFNAASNL